MSAETAGLSYCGANGCCRESPLTEEGRAEIQQHPVYSREILQRQHLDPAVVAAVVGHHEFLDGSGYPDGLAGDDIPTLTRIMTICDISSASTEDRSYKEAQPPWMAFSRWSRWAASSTRPRFSSSAPSCCQGITANSGAERQRRRRGRLTQRPDNRREVQNRYGHFTTGGSDDRIESTLPPVFRPKMVPRS